MPNANLSQPTALTPGFPDVVADSQNVFRRLLEAMSRPGKPQTIEIDIDGPATLDLAATAIALALVDYETPLYLSPALSTEASRAYLKFHCGTQITTESKDATFAILDGAPDDLSAFNSGTDEYPENGATLLIQIETISDDGPLVLTGPGIKDQARLGLSDVPDSFWAAREAKQRYFPRGIDLVFVSGASMVAIPRTTTVSLTAGKE
ncbi:phosphonate C-P lyase system protein PhnH [Nisaea acidiphila]|uniref:Phosphonate C-P lyase system protein PhnH n=1 Tax=Nisaea acidiphila TaxID=1862145 RepID=A0A9J7AT22_9PROT|nr:phosphonate C-P lyase system protein PhnH [Nisaea acidiphila]UUX50010.1 phosphonate C-P lyase system protein PhnH [Nisaea acidiphila]